MELSYGFCLCFVVPRLHEGFLSLPLLVDQWLTLTALISAVKHTQAHTHPPPLIFSKQAYFLLLNIFLLISTILLEQAASERKIASLLALRSFLSLYPTVSPGVNPLSAREKLVKAKDENMT